VALADGSRWVESLDFKTLQPDAKGVRRTHHHGRLAGFHRAG
jgi:hypothetical protein